MTNEKNVGKMEDRGRKSGGRGGENNVIERMGNDGR